MPVAVPRRRERFGQAVEGQGGPGEVRPELAPEVAQGILDPSILVDR